MLLWCLITVFCLASGWDSVGAQNPLTIQLLYPSEHETFYSGPASLLYSIQIKGQVSGSSSNLGRIQVRLDVVQNGVALVSATTHPQGDGRFDFDATVNAESSGGDFTPVELESRCGDCHYRAGMTLPAGPTLLRVTATDPAGQRAIAERQIRVDRSIDATLPVRVTLADRPDQPIANVPVIGATRIYLWRARAYSANTDAGGQALVHLESLSQAPTEYSFRVEPTVVDGLLYESIAPVTVTLAAGATTAPPVELRVRARAGQIIGTLLAPGSTALVSVPIRAIHLPDGISFQALTSTPGVFTFSNLPVGQYLIVVEPNASGLTSEPRMLDLARSPAASITLPVKVQARSAIRGAISDDAGGSLPFAWVTLNQGGLAFALLPGIAELTLPALSVAPITVSVTVPGYYSQQQVITPTAGVLALVDVNLVRRPETRTLPWGDGQVTVPPESQATIENRQITLTRGWLWGNGSGQAIVLRTPEGRIAVTGGAFALERVSDSGAWLYITQGEARVDTDSGAAVTVGAGEMVALVSGKTPRPAPMDPVVVAALHPAGGLPAAAVWQASLEVQARDRFSQMGIGAMQITTFATYSLVMLLLVVAPMSVIIWWGKRRRKG